ncbi:MAG: hypothetical protein ACR2HH_09905 [Chthoniobacterales bacterium]
MKSTYQFSDRPRDRSSFFAGRHGSRSLQTDFHYQAGTIDFAGRCGGESNRSFRGISADYFRSEARRNFRHEAAVFGLIAATVAIPVVQSIYALFRLVYSGL